MTIRSLPGAFDATWAAMDAAAQAAIGSLGQALTQGDVPEFERITQEWTIRADALDGPASPTIGLYTAFVLKQVADSALHQAVAVCRSRGMS